MRPKLNVKKGDEVFVIAGKDKGQKGEILKTYPAKQRVIVRGVNMVTKHVKPSAANPEGGIDRKEASIHVSNVMHVDPESGLPTRIGRKFMEDGRKVRYAKRSGEIIDKI